MPLEALDGLWSRRLVIHNAAFELAMLRGLPRDVVDTMQLSSLLHGTGWAELRLDTTAKAVLGIDLRRTCRRSDWSAARLSAEQIAYAALDAVVAHRAGRAMWRDLDPDARRAFAVQNAAVPVIAGMALAGIPFDPEIHRQTILTWEREQAEARAAFVAATGEEVPPQGPQRSAWLEHHLRDLGADDELRRWPRNDATGTLKTGAEHLTRIAWCEWARPLLAVAKADQRLSGFGRKLLAAIHPVTGRVHGRWKPCGQKSGRTSCSSPNLLGLPPEARRAVVAPAGRMLVIADFGQIELRIAGELSRRPRDASGVRRGSRPPPDHRGRHGRRRRGRRNAGAAQGRRRRRTSATCMARVRRA